MLCGISGETPVNPVASLKTGTIFEKRLIEEYIKEHGKEPGTDQELSVDDLMPLKSARIVRPRQTSLTSIPALLAAFQNEWDALALETYKLHEELAKTRQELATALYQNDAAVRVIARLTRECNEARDALSSISLSASGATGGDGMVIDSTETLPEHIASVVDDTLDTLSKSRKKRPIPEGWLTMDEAPSLSILSTNAIPVQQPSSMVVQDSYATISGLDGVGIIYSLAANEVERQIAIKEAVTDSTWVGTKLLFATAKGSVKLFDKGEEITSFSNHAGPATGLSLHPCGELLASVGVDKSVVLYDLNEMKRVGRCFAESPLTCCSFHPDGHIIAVGTTSGDVKLFMTRTLEEAAEFALGAPIQAVTFSENGFWLAATAKGQTTVSIFDLRKQGDAATVKELDIGGTVRSICWDYSGQFLATGGSSGITVQQYSKGSKTWSEPLRNSSPAICVRWGPEAKTLVALSEESLVSVFGLKTE